MSTASQQHARPVSTGMTPFADSAVPMVIAGIALLAGVPLLGLVFGGDIRGALVPAMMAAIFLLCSLIFRLDHRLAETNRRLAALEAQNESSPVDS